MTARRIEALLAAYTPFPMCIINNDGKVTRANSRIADVFIYDGIVDADIYALTGVKLSEYRNGSHDKDILISRNGKVFKILTTPLSEEADAPMLICFHDVTSHETLKSLYRAEMTCVAVISIDNFDELSSSTAEDQRSALVTRIDKAVRQWAAGAEASITRFKDHMYIAFMERSRCDRLIEGKFAILDEVREFETGADFPATLSIGIGIGGRTAAKTDRFAYAALDLALGRGGDQAVVKRGNKLEYYGGKTQTVEKSNKGKSRIMAHAIKQLMDQSSKVMIMGHKNPDMDVFGAALGIYRLAVNANKEAHIILNRCTDNTAEIYAQAKETGVYSFISGEKAMAIADSETLAVVVDTHRPSLAECPELLGATDRIVIIDHHRKAEESIENPTLSYMEPYASSTSELVTEIMQYTQDRKNFSKFEAEALLAGITVDTNRFAGKTGVRTFEAASWLRRMGADTSAVKRFFQSDAAAFKVKAKCVAGAEFLECGAALSICEGPNREMQLLNAQAADMLLDIKGIKASFVAGLHSDGFTAVSARSLGEINVQLIMEEFGGGGQLMAAGAQTDMSPEDVLARLRAILGT